MYPYYQYVVSYTDVGIIVITISPPRPMGLDPHGSGSEESL